MIRKVGTGARPWRARLALRGLPTQRSFATKREAEEWERQERDRYAREQAGLPVQKGPIKYGALCDLYLDNYTAKSKPWFEGMLGHSRKAFGSSYAHTILSEEVGRWLHRLPLTPKTQAHILKAMRQVLNAGVEWNYLTHSPIRNLKVPAGADAPGVILPFESWHQVKRVAYASGRYGPLIRFACATGLRPGEWAALEWKDIDKTAGVIHVLRTIRNGEVIDAGKTSGALRAVTLSRPAASALLEQERALRGPIFQAPKGGYIHLDNWRSRVWKDALTNAGLADRPLYQMRHTFATLALAQGCTIEWIAKQMGHTNIRTTLKYYARFVKTVDDRMKSLLDQMEETNVQPERPRSSP